MLMKGNMNDLHQVALWAPVDLMFSSQCQSSETYIETDDINSNSALLRFSRTPPRVFDYGGWV
jgi:hypothetical protein